MSFIHVVLRHRPLTKSCPVDVIHSGAADPKNSLSYIRIRSLNTRLLCMSTLILPSFDQWMNYSMPCSRILGKMKLSRNIPSRKWPADIEAYITRDYQQLVPGDKRSLFQAGFMIVKPSQQVFDELVQVILEGNFVEGWKNTSGWAALVMLGRLGPRLCKG
jgi:hypothetical protein